MSPTAILHCAAAPAAAVTYGPCSGRWGGGVPGVVQTGGSREGAIPGTRLGPDTEMDLNLDLDPDWPRLVLRPASRILIIRYTGSKGLPVASLNLRLRRPRIG